MKIRPIQNRVLVRRDKNEDKTPGGIVIPENAREKVTRGEVLAVGPGKFEYGKFFEPLVKRGDKVLFGKYSGTEVKTVSIDGEDLLVMSEDDIYGVIEED